MAAKGGRIDFMFLGPSLTRPLDPLLNLLSFFHAKRVMITTCTRVSVLTSADLNLNLALMFCTSSVHFPRSKTYRNTYRENLTNICMTNSVDIEEAASFR